MKNKYLHSSFKAKNSAFTLVEVMVSAALIVIVMGFLITTINETQRVIKGTTSRVNQFQASRVGFEALTRTLSQATLNTYWDMDFDTKTGNPTGYRRQSDMHFYTGPVGDLLKEGKEDPLLTYPGHGVFFQAPLGFTEKAEDPKATDAALRAKSRYAGLSSALNATGFYVEWGDGLKYAKAPKFLKDEDGVKAGEQFRYRLIQVIQPSELMSVYNNTNYSKQSPYKYSTDWIKAATGKIAIPAGLDSVSAGTKKNHSRVLADNVMGLLILPKLAEKDRGTNIDDSGLTSSYTYDTRPQVVYDAYDKIAKNSYDLTSALSSEEKKQVHQLPPVLQVVMVAIDEGSAIKLEDFCVKKNSKEPYDYFKKLFQKSTGNIMITKFLADIGEDKDTVDPDTLAGRMLNKDNTLQTPKLNYRVFSADVQIRGAKWSKIY